MGMLLDRNDSICVTLKTQEDGQLIFIPSILLIGVCICVQLFCHGHCGDEMSPLSFQGGMKCHFTMKLGTGNPRFIRRLFHVESAAETEPFSLFLRQAATG